MIGALLGVFAIIAGKAPGLRPGGQFKAPFARYRDLDAGSVPAVVLTVLATVTFAATITISAGVVLGLCMGLIGAFGLRLSPGITRSVMTAVGMVAAAFTAVGFVVDGGSDVATGFRLLLASVALVTFFLTALLFRRSRALAGARGLAMFGLVDVVTFLASPGGVEVLGLERPSFLLLLVASIGVALLLGYAASPFAISAAALMSVAAEIVLSTADETNLARSAGTLTACGVAAAVAAAFARR